MTDKFHHYAKTTQRELEYKYKITPAALRVIVKNIRHNRITKESKNLIAAYIMSAPVRNFQQRTKTIKLKFVDVCSMSKELGIKKSFLITALEQLVVVGVLSKNSESVYSIDYKKSKQLLQPSYNVQSLAWNLFKHNCTFTRKHVLSGEFNSRYTESVLRLKVFNLSDQQDLMKFTSLKQLSNLGISKSMVELVCGDYGLKLVQVRKAIDLSDFEIGEDLRNFSRIHEMQLQLPSVIVRKSLESDFINNTLGADINNPECETMNSFAGVMAWQQQVQIAKDFKTDLLLKVSDVKLTVCDFFSKKIRLTGRKFTQGLFEHWLTFKAYWNWINLVGEDTVYRQIRNQFNALYESTILKAYTLKSHSVHHLITPIG